MPPGGGRVAARDIFNALANLTTTARGASDREIAARLSLSVRTVNAHLRSVYGKLGVAGRLPLQTLLGPRRGEPREPN